jgi:hypothetical protein
VTPPPAVASAPPPAEAPTATEKPAKSGGFFHGIGHFFSKLFGRG